MIARYETPKHKDIGKDWINIDADVDVNVYYYDEDVVVSIPVSAFKTPKTNIWYTLWHHNSISKSHVHIYDNKDM